MVLLMSKIITVEDCDKLKEMFEKYCDTAEQFEFPLLTMIYVKLNNSIEDFHNADEVTDQKEARAMFRTVLKVIHADYSEYEEDESE